jgi:hypothetical protein
VKLTAIVLEIMLALVVVILAVRGTAATIAIILPSTHMHSLYLNGPLTEQLHRSGSFIDGFFQQPISQVIDVLEAFQTRHRLGSRLDGLNVINVSVIANLIVEIEVEEYGKVLKLCQLFNAQTRDEVQYLILDE